MTKKGVVRQFLMDWTGKFFILWLSVCVLLDEDLQQKWKSSSLGIAISKCRSSVVAWILFKVGIVIGSILVSTTIRAYGGMNSRTVEIFGIPQETSCYLC